MYNDDDKIFPLVEEDEATDFDGDAFPGLEDDLLDEDEVLAVVPGEAEESVEIELEEGL